MKHNAVIDTSALIWDKTDFLANQHNYYNLVTALSSLLKKLEFEREIVPLLLRKELGEEVSLAFPWQELPGIFHEFRIQVIAFLSRVGPKMVSFTEFHLEAIQSIPKMKKDHFSDKTIAEVGFLMSKMHTSEAPIVYFTFTYLWNGSDAQRTIYNSTTQEYVTIVCDEGIDDFFENIKPTFEHNVKHDKKPDNDKESWTRLDNKEGFESRLSCFDGTDTSVPQSLLNRSVSYKGKRYVYDHENETYVVFMAHRENLFHGFDEYDSKKIPENIKEVFLVYKY